MQVMVFVCLMALVGEWICYSFLCRYRNLNGESELTLEPLNINCESCFVCCSNNTNLQKLIFFFLVRVSVTCDDGNDDGDSNDKGVGYLFIFICHQQFNMWMQIKYMEILKSGRNLT